MQSIILKNLRFYSYHGVLPQERKVGAYFTVNVRLTVNVVQSIFTDELIHTVNYAEVYEVVRKEMEVPSKLLEHVAGRILTKLFDGFALIENIEFCIFKDNPPMGTDNGITGFEMNISRTEMEKLRDIYS